MPFLPAAAASTLNSSAVAQTKKSRREPSATNTGWKRTLSYAPSKKQEFCVRKIFIACAFGLLAASSGVVSAAPEHKNLQVLDKNISKDDLKKTMNEFSEALGVKCSFCHIPDQYEKDDRKHKLDARKMIKLVQHMRAMKADYFKVSTKAEEINCAVCHRGKAEPEPFVP